MESDMEHMKNFSSECGGRSFPRPREPNALFSRRCGSPFHSIPGTWNGSVPHTASAERSALHLPPQTAAEIVYRVRDALRLLWSRWNEWMSLSEFDPLREIGRERLAESGIFLNRSDDGDLYIDIPFRPETMP
jgi:hypothetical protein